MPVASFHPPALARLINVRPVRGVKEATGIDRVPRSTLSDNLAKFDPSSLKPLIAELLRRFDAQPA